MRQGGRRLVTSAPRPATAGRTVLDSVQVARALAALMVVGSHGLLWAQGIDGQGGSGRFLAPLGSVGVMIFFTVSGFIMVHATAGQHGRKGMAVRFMVRRLIRIAPLYWLMTLAAFALALKDGLAPSGLHLAQSLLFIPYADGEGPMRPILGVGWTLNYEMMFYACFALSLLFRRGLMLLIVALIGLVAAGQIINPITTYHNPRTAIETWTDPILLPFVGGMALGIVRTFRSEYAWDYPNIRLTAMVTIICLIAGLLVAVGTYPVWWRLGIMALAIGAAAFPILADPVERPPGWLVHLGSASYSLYLVHPLLFGVTRRIIALDPFPLPAPLSILLYCAVCVGAALILYGAVERPVTRWLLQRLMPAPIERPGMRSDPCAPR
jgi:exopolysaccharide production protein ExoZ